MQDALEIESYSLPVTEDSAVGNNLREDNSINSLYFQIKDARTAARDIERQRAMGVETDEAPRWDNVVSLCLDALETQTKDLEIAAWLAEALLRTRGFTGLAEGLNLITTLCDRYWDAVYPLPDEDGLETRLAPLVSLNGDDYEGTLIRPIFHVNITEGSSIGPFALWQYQQAIENAKLTDKNLIAKRKEQGSVFLDHIQAAVQESTPEFYQTLQVGLQQSREALANLATVLEARCGQDVSLPPRAKILHALDDFSDHIRFILKDAPFTVVETSTVETPNTPDEDNAMEPTLASNDAPVIKPAVATSGALHNREDALKLLGDLAEYFRKSEPQSPLPFLLERAQRLGRMSFPELLQELVSDDGARNAAYELMGVANKE